MHSKTLVLATVSATAVAAQPHRSHHHWHGSGTGWWPRPTGGFGGDYNITTTIEYTSTIYSTVTVTPVDATSFVNVAASSGTPVADASIDQCGGDTTVTATATQFFTITAVAVSSSATADAAAASSSDVSPASSSSTSADAVVDATSTSSSSVAAGAFYGSTTASAAATSSSAASTYASTPGSGTGAKKGISFNVASMVSAFGSSVSWAYNWGSTSSGTLDGCEYVPMMWGLNSVNDFASKVGSAKNVLSFNEPDLGAQSNIDPSTAAAKHIEGMKSLVGKARIGSPAVTNANSTSPLMGQQWLEQFFSACGSSCPVDFIAFHWYSGADEIDYFKNYVNNMAAFAKSKGISGIWLTEFEPQGSSDAQASFMSQAVPFLDSHPMVERYAGFMASEGTMLSGNSLNAMGKAYAG